MSVIVAPLVTTERLLAIVILPVPSTENTLVGVEPTNPFIKVNALAAAVAELIVTSVEVKLVSELVTLRVFAPVCESRIDDSPVATVIPPALTIKPIVDIVAPPVIANPVSAIVTPRVMEAPPAIVSQLL